MRRPALRIGLLGALAASAAAAQSGPPFALPEPPATARTPETEALQAALRRFPPLIVGSNVEAIAESNQAVPRPCPAAGSRVEQKGGPTMEFLGISQGNPELCRMKVGGEEMDAWFGIWGTDWPGAATAYPAIKHAMQSRTGDVVGFDTVAHPGVAEWHDLIRNDGVEEIPLLGKTYRAVKLAHYREGFNGNTYRSVATLWIDLLTGLPVYATYQHIAGKPELESPLIPTAIVPAP